MRKHHVHSIGLASSAFLSLLFVTGASTVLGDMRLAYDAYDRGDYATARQEFQSAAEQGDASAQYNLGVIHHQGLGVPQDS
ncbi:MAG: hypothetical protein ACE5NA_09315, partial [Nitrospiraceae bacterium]